MHIIAGLIGAAIAAISVPLYPYLFDPAQPSMNEVLFGAPSSGANYVANTLKLPNLLSKDCLGTDGTGLVQEGTCTGGGGGGSGNVSTSTSETRGRLAYWTSTSATPALLGEIATTSLTISSPLTTSGTPGALVGGTNLTVDIDDIKAADLDLTDITLSDFTNDAGFTTFAYLFPSNSTSTNITFSGGLTGALTGNADTATALAGNGTNCSAGSYALGVDASGNSEGCTDATTEINSAISTHASDAEAHQALVTLAGTPDYITISGQQITRGTIDIGDDTNLTAGDGITLTGDDLDCDTASGSVFGCLSSANWTTFNSKLGSYDAWTHPQTGTSATTSGMIFTAASSTFTGGFSALNGTTTNATSTSLAITTALRLFGTTYTTLAALGNALVNAVTAVTPTGTWNFGGATSVEMVNGSSPTVDAIGEIALDTTSNYLLVATSTNAGGAAVLPPFQTISFTYATTSWTGTTTLMLGPAFKAQQFKNAYCETTTGTAIVSLNDGTNRATDITASTTINLIQVAGSNTFTAGETRRIDIGNPASSPVKIACTLVYVYTRD